MIKNIITPNWDAPAQVHAFMTTRLTEIHGQAGISAPPFNAFNIATHVNDNVQAVAHNRALLREIVPSEPLWLNQTHGIDVFSMESDPIENFESPPEADAILVTDPQQVAVIMTADCLPVLFTTRAGNMVAAAHAGWRSLVSGILEATVNAMVAHGAERGDIIAWMGAAIGSEQFEVGAEVREAFITQGQARSIPTDAVARCFTERPHNKYLADIYTLARLRLHSAGLSDDAQIFGGGLCTVSDAQQFYSYRRDGATGRMASVIWFE